MDNLKRLVQFKEEAGDNWYLWDGQKFQCGEPENMHGQYLHVWALMADFDITNEFAVTDEAGTGETTFVVRDQPVDFDDDTVTGFQRTLPNCMFIGGLGDNHGHRTAYFCGRGEDMPVYRYNDDGLVKLTKDLPTFLEKIEVYAKPRGNFSEDDGLTNPQRLEKFFAQAPKHGVFRFDDKWPIIVNAPDGHASDFGDYTSYWCAGWTDDVLCHEEEREVEDQVDTGETTMCFDDEPEEADNYFQYALPGCTLIAFDPADPDLYFVRNDDPKMAVYRFTVDGEIKKISTNLVPFLNILTPSQDEDEIDRISDTDYE